MVRFDQVQLQAYRRRMIEINGAYGEGGGQILRTSLTLSALTGKPFNIINIRANRSKPGLRPQHLTAAQAAARITRAQMDGAFQGSQRLSFIPDQPHSGRYQFNIPTAGALTLVLQTIFLPLSFAKGSSQVALRGGTHVPWSPTFHYLTELWLPCMESLGFRGACQLNQAGFYPHGGGEAHMKVHATQEITPLTALNRGKLIQIRGISGVANLDESIARRQKHQALRRLAPICQDTKIKTLQLSSPGKGTFILLKAVFSGSGWACFSALGAPGKRAEAVADEAVEELLTFLNTDACLDPHLADQVLLPLALVKGSSHFTSSCITQHLLTNAHVIQKFLPVNIQIKGDLGEPGEVSISGEGIDLALD